MEDVAAVAGVSVATVSRAFGKPDSVSPELRRRVLESAERLGFRPSVLAGSLASARARIVGVVVPSLLTSFFGMTLEALAGRLGPAGYQMMVGHHEYDLEREEALVAASLDWSPAAIVVTGATHSRATLSALARAECPVVEMWELSERPIDTAVGFSSREAGRAVAHHLIAGGRRRLAFVGGAMGRDLRAAARGQGFVEAAREAGLPEPRVEALEERSSTAGGIAAFARLMDSGEPPEAIAFSNDFLALGALFEAQRRGVRIPEDVALAGYGDLEFAANSTPTLTTVRPPHRAIGTAVADHLLRRFEDPEAGGEIIDLGFELVARASG
ncbi:LacI family DNA-binding transcriptional regulator (plasmid) [Geminicoccaceae bacterium 1502E]|nr:LacI family DNA-binding transcriptional regulator [Geminicoccaceae bacterium 1502E]